MKRVVFGGAVLGFWLWMNLQLWRSELSPRSQQGTTVSVESIWEKLLTANDDSTLSIIHTPTTNRIGFLKWSPSVISEPSPFVEFAEEMPPAGVSGYALDLDGDFILKPWEIPQRLRVSGRLELGTNSAWKEIQLRVSLRPSTWEFHASAAERVVRLSVSEGADSQVHQFSFDQLRDPQTLLGTLQPGWLPPLLPRDLPAPFGATNANPNLGLEWVAHKYASMPVRGGRVRCYRVATRLLGQWPVTAFISHSGEILRLELPSGVLIVNDALPQ